MRGSNQHTRTTSISKVHQFEPPQSHTQQSLASKPTTQDTQQSFDKVRKHQQYPPTQQLQKGNSYPSPSSVTPHQQQQVSQHATTSTSQYVHQVIYNQGCLVINNPSSAQTSHPHSSHKHDSLLQKPSIVNSRQQQPGHQKTKSLQSNILDQSSSLAQQQQQHPLKSKHQKLPEQPHNSRTVAQSNPLNMSASSFRGTHKKSNSFAQQPSQVVGPSQKQVSTGKRSLEKKAQQYQQHPNEDEFQLSQSMDNAAATKHRKQQPSDPNEQELMRVLQQDKVQSSNQVTQAADHCYQQLSDLSVGSKETGSFSNVIHGQSKHVRAQTQGYNAGGQVQQTQYQNPLDNSKVFQVQQSTKQIRGVRPPSSKPSAKASSTKQTFIVAAQDKIASSGKVISSSGVVKQKTQKHSSAEQQVVHQAPSHHRIKSDEFYAHKLKDLSHQQPVVDVSMTKPHTAQSAVQQQKGKVGKILKNNFVESATTQPTSGKQFQVAFQQDHQQQYSNSFVTPSQQQQQILKSINKTFQQPVSSATLNQQQLATQSLVLQQKKATKKKLTTKQPSSHNSNLVEQALMNEEKQPLDQKELWKLINQVQQQQSQDFQRKSSKQPQKVQQFNANSKTENSSTSPRFVAKFNPQTMYTFGSEDCSGQSSFMATQNNDQSQQLRGNSWDGKSQGQGVKKKDKSQVVTIQQQAQLVKQQQRIGQQQQLVQHEYGGSSTSLQQQQMQNEPQQQQPQLVGLHHIRRAIQQVNPQPHSQHPQQQPHHAKSKSFTNTLDNEFTLPKAHHSQFKNLPHSKSPPHLNQEGKCSPVSSGGSSLHHLSDKQHNNALRQSYQLRGGQADQPVVEQQVKEGGGKAGHLRKISGGASSDSNRFKFNKNINGVPVFQPPQQQQSQAQQVQKHIAQAAAMFIPIIEHQQTNPQPSSQPQISQQQKRPESNKQRKRASSKTKQIQQSSQVFPNQTARGDQFLGEKQPLKIDRKFRISTTTTNQSPRFNSPTQRRVNTTYNRNNSSDKSESPTANQGVVGGNCKQYKNDEMMILENHKTESLNTLQQQQQQPQQQPQQPQPQHQQQLSDWDKMIFQQFNNQKKKPSLQKPLDQKQLAHPKIQKALAKPTHTKNKLSNNSDLPKRQIDFSQLKSNQPVKLQILNSQGHHKKVKSEVPALKNLISSQQQQEQDSSKPSSQNISQKSNKFFIRNRLEAAGQDDQKQFNVSIEELDIDIDTDKEEVEEAADLEQLHKVSQQEKSKIVKINKQQVGPPQQVQQEAKQQLANQKKHILKRVKHQRLQSEIVPQVQAILQENNQPPSQLNVPPNLHEITKQQYQQKRKDSAHRKNRSQKITQDFIFTHAPQNSLNQIEEDSQPSIPPAVTPTSEVVQVKQQPQKKQKSAPKKSSDDEVIRPDERIVTEESMESNIAAGEKQHRKLVHHIRKAFQKQGECPATTVEFYNIGKVLGKGAFGKVNLALQLVSSQHVAIKSINTTHFSEEAQLRKVMQEVTILKQTRHRNIVQLFEYFQTSKHVLFVFELSSGGDLLSYVRKRRTLKELEAKSVFKQIIEALKYCHDKRILHRDIKLDNILLTIEGVVKICDFGVSKIAKQGERMTEQCGTPAYIAPEILVDQGYEGFAIDIWSAGVVLYAMLYGTVPFRANNMTELQKMIMKGDVTLQDGISKEAQDLLKKLLEKDPSQRITIPGILAHSWMRDAKDTVELFTSAEKSYMRSQYKNSQGENNLNCGSEHDQLETYQNEMLKNAETKSVILCPFNSTRSNLQEIENNYRLPTEIREMIQSKSCLKFAQRVREIDKQYEVNNNAELDNGVYHDFNIGGDDKKKDKLEREDSLQSDFRETLTSMNKNKESKPQTELQKLEKMMLKNSEANKAEPGALQVAQSQTSKQKASQEEEPRQPIDEELVSEAALLGYSPARLRSYLERNELNNATTTYFLLQIKKQSMSSDTTQKKESN